ncbi:MAG: CBS domain-containing protein [Candidatus Krumholzibacteriota bacterium]|nr:CBS domain-containing protein [Candidatus Krumholzibacteriota bacterium]
MVVVRQLLENKGPEIHSISPDASVYTSLMLMAEKRIGALLVIENEELVGVISERDYARKVILRGKSSKETSVREIMSSKVFYVGPDHRIEECMALMTEKSIRHLPVLEGGELMGVVSIGDIIKAVISEQEFIIDQLEQFIMGR